MLRTFLRAYYVYFDSRWLYKENDCNIKRSVYLLAFINKKCMLRFLKLYYV